MFLYWACLGFYASIPFFVLRSVDAKNLCGPFRLGSVRTLAILVGIVACDAGFVIRIHHRYREDALAFLAVDLSIIGATVAVAALARLTVSGTLALSWILSAFAFLIALFSSDD
ncbi:hypothetical protein TA3x_004199 [Tundrisphaera sp. TA3]|uniref:hypothetical protein n=1 Tax=Tundrisphaera sp. TA3 TaxID=3435775 RepID=UPI003EBB1BE8